LELGIIGWPGSGKTTLLYALTGGHVHRGSRPREKNVGAVKVPDERLETLHRMLKAPKAVPAEVVFADYAGEGQKPGAFFEPQTVNQIKTADALVFVTGTFPEYGAMHTGSAPNPSKELSDMEMELILNDLIVVENRAEKLRKEGRKDRETELLDRLKKSLDEGESLRGMHFESDEIRMMEGFKFLSIKPLLAVCNLGEGDADPPEDLARHAQDRGIPVLSLCAGLEREIAELPEPERDGFMKEMGLDASAGDRVIRAGYDLLNLITFFTHNENEVRAWPVIRGINAIGAAGRIHSDMERGFIRAEVIGYEEFLSIGNFHKAREEGRLRLEGKEYQVQDGDIIQIRFNV